MLLYIFIVQLLILSLNASINEQRFPTLWFEAPSSISDYPLVNNCSSSSIMNNTSCRLIDPWLYLDRLGLYKILIQSTTHLMKTCSTSALFDGCNILVGLAAQLGWQFDSNRLFSNGTREISINSWWGSYNYYLSVIPFLAAVDKGIIHGDLFQIVKRDNFCSNSSECFNQVEGPMIEWSLFFDRLLHPGNCSFTDLNYMHDRCYLGPMWRAHTNSTINALPIIESKLSVLPSKNEQQFGLGWVNVLVLIGMARRNTNLVDMNNCQDLYLPKRILRDNDRPPRITDLPETVNLALQLLLSITIDSYPELVDDWVEATCSYKARKDARVAIYIVPVNKIVAAAFVVSAEAEILIYGCDDE
ncbi:unnamed protein product [Adineta steineri]|uniref:Uncharacterized protein n=1 Tax=Adineta steineri TaxID=433720 RepID=A0A813T6K0_9BILA|nr:unnamed protein product [Adineta steineri]CAF0918518.1 unnamed protein product [Adineta steineri]